MHFFHIVSVSAHSGYIIRVWRSIFVSPDVDGVNNIEKFAVRQFFQELKGQCSFEKLDKLLVFKLYVAWTVFGCAP